MRLRRHTIKYGDTMQNIAQKYFNDVSAWLELIEHNNLKYPYIVDSYEEKMKKPEDVVTIGDTIVIPIASALNTISPSGINKRDKDMILELSLGRDLDITSNVSYYNNHGTSDEILGFSADGKDLDTVKGVENVKQQLIARLLTARGSLNLHPNYGSNLDVLFGLNTVEQAQLIETDVCQTLKQDTRVADVVIKDWKIEGNEYSGTYEVVLRGFDEAMNLVLSNDSSGIFALFE